MYKRFYLLLLLLCSTLCASAQNAVEQTQQTNLMDSFYASGKIITVVISLAIVLSILIFYLIRLEKKLNKLEKNN